MRSTRQQARFAGLLYVFMVITGLPGLILIPRSLFVYGDAAATANHLRASETLMRLGIASELFHQVVFLFLAIALYRLFESVNRSAALQMLILVLVSVPIMFLNVTSEIAALTLVSAPPFLGTFTRSQLDSLAYLFVRLHGQGIGVAAQAFWSLWLVPFGILVMRCGFIPRILGVLLFAGAAGEMGRAVTTLFPGAYANVLDPVAQVLAVGEFPIIVWLAIWGANEKRVPGTVTAVA